MQTISGGERSPWEVQERNNSYYEMYFLLLGAITFICPLEHMSLNHLKGKITQEAG